MKRVFAVGLALICLSATQVAFSQYIEKLPFGDMEQWQTRVIKESFLLGGEICLSK